MNVAGIQLLSHLEEAYPCAKGEGGGEEKITVSLIACLASFTDPREKWSGQEAFQQAHLLLSKILKPFRAETERFQGLIAVLLETQVKIVFAKSKNPSVTAQGRKAINPAPTTYMVSDAENEVKPWKFQHIYIVTVFRWLLQNVNVRLEV